MTTDRIKSIRIEGYRPFGLFEASMSSLEVLVGANAAGKSSLFEFLKFIRDSAQQEIPPEIVVGSIGQQIFHRPGPDKFRWSLEIESGFPSTLRYEGELLGPVGAVRIVQESLKTSAPLPGHNKPLVLMDIHGGRGVVYNPPEGKLKEFEQPVDSVRSNRLALSEMTNSKLRRLYSLREYVQGWRFYGAFFDNAAMRVPAIVEPDAVLHERCGNLSSVLSYLRESPTPSAFSELQVLLRMLVPGFKELTLRTAAPGRVMAYWREEGVPEQLSLADLSDGTLRILCWLALCFHPSPPPLVCIDEPDQGLHPRALPALAGLLTRLSSRTQVLVATHSSYFLAQFEMRNIGVIKRDHGNARFFRPVDSKALLAMLEDFGSEELETMHKSTELETLA